MFSPGLGIFLGDFIGVLWCFIGVVLGLTPGFGALGDFFEAIWGLFGRGLFDIF